jgi:hypothetical protein
MMRYLKLAVASGAAVLVLAGTGLATATGASAAATHPAATVALRGGHTTVTTGKGIAAALLSNGIVPIAVAPGAEALKANLSSPAVTLTFPVTGGRASLVPLGGYVTHRGGILFFNIKNGKDIEVSNFIISLKHADLTGIVNGNPHVRVALLNLHLAHARIRVSGHTVIARHIGLTLTAGAASALDASLGTTLFSPGLRLGSATSVLRI